MKDKMEKPDIYRYYDYRKYLSDLFDFKKSGSKAFSHRYINTKAGFKSPNALKNVVDGRKNLSLEGAEKYAGAFKMEPAQRRCFLALVKYNLAKSVKEKEEAYLDLVKIKKKEAPHILKEEAYDVFSHWRHLVIREITALPDYRNSSKWISRVLQPPVTPGQASDSLKLLRKLGLIEKTEKGWKPVYQTMKTGDKVDSVKAASFHRDMIRLGSEAIQRFEPQDREISGTTISVAKNDLPALVRLLRDFRKQVLDFAADSRDADQVYQLNFQLFPLVKTSRPKRLKEDREEKGKRGRK